MIELPTFPPEVLGDEPLVPLPGSSVTFPPIGSFEATTPIIAGVHGESLVKALSTAVVVDCVAAAPRASDSR